MPRRGGSLGTAGVLMLAGAWFAAAAAEIPGERQAELLHLLRQDCGSCHGLTLRGGLGPPLTAEALAGRSPQALRDAILNGRPGTPMAPWRAFMSEPEAAWLVQVLLEGVADAR